MIIGTLLVLLVGGSAAGKVLMCSYLCFGSNHLALGIHQHLS
jgi:hypothetical protein